MGVYIYTVPERVPMNTVLRFLRSEEGATAVEYAVMLAMIILVCIGAVIAVGQNTSSMWSDNEAGLQSAFNP